MLASRRIQNSSSQLSRISSSISGIEISCRTLCVPGSILFSIIAGLKSRPVVRYTNVHTQSIFLLKCGKVAGYTNRQSSLDQMAVWATVSNLEAILHCPRETATCTYTWFSRVSRGREGVTVLLQGLVQGEGSSSVREGAEILPDFFYTHDQLTVFFKYQVIHLPKR